MIAYWFWDSENPLVPLTKFQVICISETRASDIYIKHLYYACSINLQLSSISADFTKKSGHK